MEVIHMERRKFLESIGKCGIGAGLCSLLALPSASQTQDTETQLPGHSCQERIEFAEGWLKNFMRVLDENADDQTKRRIMEANGIACARNYLESTGRVIEPIPFEEWVARVKEQGGGGAIQIEGNTIYYQYLKNYQGLDAPEDFCLCPFVETKPEGLSATYCHCSVGYIMELFERRFGRPVKVELLESVLRGGKRCKFKIELA